MLCYKDMTFCSSNTCGNFECPRNTRGPLFTPDEWWSERVAYGSFEATCTEYVKDEDVPSV